jgi:hypothetical protein
MAFVKGNKQPTVRYQHTAILAGVDEKGQVLKDRFEVVYERGDGKATLKALQADLDAVSGDDAATEMVLRRQVVSIALRDDDNRPIPWDGQEDDVWQWCMDRPAYSSEILTGVMRAAANRGFEDERRKNY